MAGYLPFTTKSNGAGNTILAAHINNLQTAVFDLTWDVKGYGAVGDGSTDDTTAIQAAIDACATAGGGIVWFPAGTYISTTLTWKTGVYGVGAGITATILKLKNTTAANLITGNNFATLTGGDTVAGIHDFGLRDMALDGNSANNASGWCFQFYGYRPFFTDVDIRNGASGGLYSQGFTATDAVSTLNRYGAYTRVNFHNNTGDGFYCNGIGDTTVTDCVFHDNSAMGFNAASRASGMKFLQSHFYGNSQDHCVQSAAIGISFNACTFEGADLSLVKLNSGGSANRFTGCHFFAAGTQTTKAGIEINSTTGYIVDACFFDSLINGAVLFTSDGGGGMIRSNYVYATSGDAFAGTAAVNTTIQNNDIQGGAGGGVGTTTTLVTDYATIKNGLEYGAITGEGSAADNLTNIVPMNRKGTVIRFLVNQAITLKNYYAPSGTANAAVTTSNTTLTDTRAAMAVNQYIGQTVTCNGKTMTVTSNTATVLTGASWSGGGNPGNGLAWDVTSAGKIITGTGGDKVIAQYGVFTIISDDPNWIVL